MRKESVASYVNKSVLHALWFVEHHNNTIERFICNKYCVQEVSLIAPTAGGILQLYLNFTGKCFIHLRTEEMWSEVCYNEVFVDKGTM